MKNMKRTIYTLITYGLIISSFFILFVIVLNTSLINAQAVLFYRGMQALLFTSVLFIALGTSLAYRKFSFIESYFSALAVAISFSLTIFVLIPVTADRSISVFLLHSLQQNQNSCKIGVTKNDLEKEFVTKYVYDNRAISRRLNEQLASQSIIKTGQCFKLSNKGKRLVKLFDASSRIFGSSHVSLQK